MLSYVLGEGEGIRTMELNEIEEELLRIKERMRSAVEDVALWRRSTGYKSIFSTQETWLLTRENTQTCNWTKGIWFPQSTPKFAFMSWLAMLNRLSTMERISRWGQNVDLTCVLCKGAVETRDHLFYECLYSSQIWEFLVKGILRNAYTNTWSGVIAVITDGSREKNSLFCVRYAFQASIHALWRERNKIRHGDKPLPLATMKKFIDKGVRNKLSMMIRNGVKGREKILQFWFATRM